MFLRIRGKGAAPENSQATLMHIRGFRHVHCPPPSTGGRYACCSDVHTGEDTSRAAAFPHFSMGIQAPRILEAQHTGSAANINDAGFTSLLAMAWKEIWNVYDICYDEVPLLPEAYDYTDTALAHLSGKAGDNAASAPSALLPDGYVLPSSLPDNKRVLVCTHYLGQNAWSADVFNQSNIGSSGPDSGGVLLLDVSGIPAAEAGTRIAVAVAWTSAFASLQVDNPLRAAGTIIVRLPYRHVPSAGILQSRAATGDAMAVAVLEMMDFIGEHISMVITACCMRPDGSELAETSTIPSPLIVFVGKDDDSELAAAATRAASGNTPVLCMFPDCYRTGTEEAQVATWANAWSATVQLLPVPVQALLDGGEEEWDPYILKERSRLNYCPCCGHCAHDNAGGEDHESHGHSHS